MSSKAKRYKDKPQHKHKFGNKNAAGGGQGPKNKGKINKVYKERSSSESGEEHGSSSGEEIDRDSNEEVKAGEMEGSQIRLAMWYFDQCDPKKCSGMILKRHGLLDTLPVQAKFQGIVLTPSAK